MANYKTPKYKRDQRKMRYRKRKEKGLCPECGNPNTGDFIKCNKHRRMGKKSQAKHYDEYKQKNLCPNCGNEVKNNYVYCNRCRDKMRKNKRNNVLPTVEEQIKRNIYLKFLSGDYTQKELGEIYNLHQSSISRIITYYNQKSDFI